jgi:RNA polymerase sigma-70 factor (ECF subfamily)
MIDFSLYNDFELLILMQEEKSTCDLAFTEIYQRSATKLNHYCYYLTRDSDLGKNLFQRVWIAFYEYAKNGKEINNILTFLIISAKNTFLNDIKSKEREKKKYEEYSQYSKSISINSEEDDFKQELILKAVYQLDEKHREPFIFKYFQDMKNEEIAKICEESVDCIRKRIYRATKLVKEYVFKHEKKFLGDL